MARKKRARERILNSFQYIFVINVKYKEISWRVREQKREGKK